MSEIDHIQLRDEWDPRLRVKLSSYTPIRTSRENILKDCDNINSKKVGIRNHYPIKESARTDKTWFCHLHKSHGHNMDEYVHLKDTIDELINKVGSN